AAAAPVELVLPETLDRVLVGDEATVALLVDVGARVARLQTAVRRGSAAATVAGAEQDGRIDAGQQGDDDDHDAADATDGEPATAPASAVADTRGVEPTTSVVTHHGRAPGRDRPTLRRDVAAGPV